MWCRILNLSVSPLVAALQARHKPLPPTHAPAGSCCTAPGAAKRAPRQHLRRLLEPRHATRLPPPSTPPRCRSRPGRPRSAPPPCAPRSGPGSGCWTRGRQRAPPGPAAERQSVTPGTQVLHAAGLWRTASGASDWTGSRPTEKVMVRTWQSMAFSCNRVRGEATRRGALRPACCRRQSRR